jgi:hypothetical protein
MKNKLIRNLILAIILVLSFPTLAFATTTGTQFNKEVDGVKATLTFNSEELQTGSNEFTISLLDKNGEPLSNPNLEITADMDRSTDMGGDGMEKEEPMMIELKEGSTAGEYTGMVDFSNDGKWIINATFDSESQAKTIDFDFEVENAGHNAGTNWFLIGGFAGVIALIIVIAAINKKKSKA